MFDAVSYILGKTAGKSVVVIEDSGITCTEDGDGIIIIENKGE